MADFQEQLRQYRLQKRRKETVDNFKDKLRRFWMLGTGANKDTTIEVQQVPTKAEVISENSQDDDAVASSSENELLPEENTIPSRSTDHHHRENNGLKYTLWAVYLLFWITLYAIAIKLSFGLVFLMFSALFGIYFNTRTDPKKRNEMSAYSVFNKNCESIDGTLKAEQFEREIRYGSGSVR
ncbi:SAYSvFN domain-containing protein 1 isoform X1 [Drosophila elegans]|uniref:SAYSvFN domain-containing protein 1 isoform X1 n=1 Tax=Drosophila elegans TaxID=30023 RepID=UPI0007E6E9F5|nr:SAYSvFN domain-containing protein 1 isoform X1 [Drosophila elegans]